ncbi:hypothetical protein FRC12_023738 [Ceratobasidium sp. 428]|nr:hypothetical protein FRC12_023738 [Ceratobasidium sp. 428]
MPLRCLSLDTANFSEVKWEDFLNSVPDLEELHIGLQHLEPQHFQLFASRLPKLRLLCFGIVDIGDVNESSERASQRIVPRPVILRGHAYFGPLPLQSSNAYNPPSAESISNAARYILSIWSNATCEIYKAAWGAICTPDEATVTRLNAAMQSLRAMNS